MGCSYLVGRGQGKRSRLGLFGLDTLECQLFVAGLIRTMGKKPLKCELILISIGNGTCLQSFYHAMAGDILGSTPRLGSGMFRYATHTIRRNRIEFIIHLGHALSESGQSFRVEPTIAESHYPNRTCFPTARQQIDQLINPAKLKLNVPRRSDDCR
jgi:hypothetical protein